MASALQNRLVGTVILVALAVIFLPDILDGEKKSNADLFVDVPSRPAMKPVVKQKSFPAQEVSEQVNRQVEIVNEQALDEPATTPAIPQNQGSQVQLESPASQQPDKQSAAAQQDSSLASQTVVEVDESKQLASAGWVIQLGSFRHQKNVRGLLDKLEKAGYRAFSRPVQTSAGTLTKVFVGPDVDKEKMQKAIPHLKEVTKLQGKLTPFTVE